MRNLVRNLSTVYFKLYEGQRDGTDQDGYYTGGVIAQYGDLQSSRLCVSANKGSAREYAFGSLEDYDRTMTTADTSCPIDEKSILWLDGADTDGPHNFVVTKKAAWKNSVLYAVKKVTVSNA